MKRLSAPATAALLLTACGTVPTAGPYGPPASPYPDGEYAPAPGATPLVPVDACPIVSSRGWRAWVSPATGPGSRPTLHLTGTVQAPSAGFRMAFDPHLQELRSYPVQVVARLRPVAPAGPAAQVITTHDVHWQWPLGSGPVGKVIVHCGDRPIAEAAVAAAP